MMINYILLLASCIFSSAAMLHICLTLGSIEVIGIGKPENTFSCKIHKRGDCGKSPLLHAMVEGISSRGDQPADDDDDE